jgi:hypothetical protein
MMAKASIQRECNLIQTEEEEELQKQLKTGHIPNCNSIKECCMRVKDRFLKFRNLILKGPEGLP